MSPSSPACPSARLLAGALLAPTLALLAPAAGAQARPTPAPDAAPVPNAAPAGTAALVGAVMDDAGTPVAGAEVVVAGLGRTVRTAANGTFRLEGLAAGSYLVRARRLGFAPTIWSVTLGPGATRAARVTLAALPAELPAVTVRARSGYHPADERRLVDFERRRAHGFGRFLSRDQLAAARAGNPTVADVLTQTWPGQFALADRTAGPPEEVARAEALRARDETVAAWTAPVAGAACTRAAVSINGQPVTPGFSAADFLTEQVEAVEAYRDAQLPIQFGQPSRGGCLVVVWTRGGASE